MQIKKDLKMFDKVFYYQADEFGWIIDFGFIVGIHQEHVYSDKKGKTELLFSVKHVSDGRTTKKEREGLFVNLDDLWEELKEIIQDEADVAGDGGFK